MKINALFPAFCLAIAGCSAATSPPNILIILTDDQGYGDFSAHGNPVLKTPNLDQLRSESIRFTQFHTAPICTPSRSQLMSGVDCLRNGAQTVSNGRDLLRRDLVTLADAFGSNYSCGLFGKWHLGDNYPYRPADRGFHEVVTYPAAQITSASDYWNNDCFDDVYLHNNKREQYHGYATDVFFDEAMKWIQKEAKENKPFLCYLATPAAHVPHFVPEHYRKLYESGELPNIDSKRSEDVARFFGMIADIDYNMAKLDSFLIKAGLKDNTIVVFMTDNGGTSGVPLFNAGMKGGKFSLFDGGHRVPCLIRWPKGQLLPPVDIPELTEMQDIFPTLLDLCGLNPPANAKFDGISLAPRLRGQIKELPDRTLFVNYVQFHDNIPKKDDTAVLWRKWRLVKNNALYDISADPGQTTNVIESYPEITARLRQHLDEWWNGLTPVINERGAIIIGSDAEPVTQLGTQDRDGSMLDQSLQIREAMNDNGTWNLEVTKAGKFKIELRRWPREIDKAIVAGLPEYKHTDGVFPAGVALPVAKARILLGDIERTLDVETTDKEVTFIVPLSVGRTKFEASFTHKDGKEICGAYYVYIQREEYTAPISDNVIETQ